MADEQPTEERSDDTQACADIFLSNGRGPDGICRLASQVEMSLAARNHGIVFLASLSSVPSSVVDGNLAVIEIGP